MIIVALALTLFLVVAGILIFEVVRAHRTPAELRGDWWPEFERQFRSYTATHRARIRPPRRSDRGGP
jgi:hypothetical protein